VKDERNRFYNIEIQTYPHPAFKDRILFGWSDSYVSQLLRGNDYTELEPVFAIVITEFPIFTESPKIHLEFTPREKDDHHLILSNHFQVHILRLELLFQGHLELLEQVTPELAYWLLFLVFGKKNEVEMLQIAEEYPIVREAFANPLVHEAVQEFRRFQADPQMQELERQRKLFLLDLQLGLNAAKTEGKAEGKAEGKVEGKAEGILDILNDKFEQVPQHIVDSLNRQTDAAVLKLLLLHASKCASLDEFAANL
jgi:predicted transposase/invertase (TIGR01784 family)